MVANVEVRNKKMGDRNRNNVDSRFLGDRRLQCAINAVTLPVDFALRFVR